MNFSTIGYCLKQGLKNITRNLRFSLASMATVSACIFLLCMFFCLVKNLDYVVKNAESNVGITVLFRETLSEEEIRGGGHLHAVDLGGLDGDHGTGEIRLPDFTIADDHHFIQEFTVLGEREDLGKFAGFEGDGRVTDATDLDDGIRRGDRQGVGSVLVGGRPSGRPLFAHSRTDDRSVLVRNHALDRVALRKGGHSCCHEQRGEKR